MAALVEGCRFGLKSANSSDRTLVFVKFTDSGITAVEDFVKLKNTTSRTASIKFDGSTGVINIPNLRQDSTRTFEFNVTSLDKDASLQQGSFDCIRQNVVNGGPAEVELFVRPELEKIGVLAHKMQIHANEDSYEKTRERMATVEQESKKNCAKVIKITGTDKSAVGRKVKLKRAAGAVPPPPILTGSGNSAVSSSVIAASSSQPTDDRASFSVSSVVPSQQARGSTVAQTSDKTGVKSSISGGSANKSSRYNNDIMKRSYRERMIHMLAVRSLKKPEIVARMRKEGLKETEKNGMTAVLSQIASLKDNTFHLQRSAWHEVHEDDWPFYSAEEKVLVRKNRNAMEKEDSAQRHSCSSLRVSPVLSGPLTPSDLSSVVSSDSGVHSNLSPSSHSEEATTPSHLLGAGNSGISREPREPEKERPQRDRERDSLKRASPAVPLELCSATDTKRPRLVNAAAPGDAKKSPPVSPSSASTAARHNPSWVTMGSTGSSYCQSSPECGSPNSQDCKSTGSSPLGDVPEYVSRYVEITSPEQRYRYKCDFAAEYPRYRKFHHTLDQVARRFRDLEKGLRKFEIGSDDFKRVGNEILAEYRKTKEDQDYQTAKKNFRFLHQKLRHIKQLVSDFDRLQHSA